MRGDIPVSIKMKITKTFISFTLLTSLFLTAGVTAQAEISTKNEVSNETIQGAYYYIDGIEYEVPSEEVSDFSKGTLNTPLPNEPLSLETPNRSTLSSDEPERAYACSAGYEYAGSRYSAGFKLGRSGIRVINDTSHDLKEVSELEKSATVSGTLSVSSGVSWGVIEGEVGFDMSASQTWTTSQSTTVTVAPGYWGWIDYGSHAETWKGSYYYLTTNCAKSNAKNVTAQGPRYKAKLAKTARYPY